MDLSTEDINEILIHHLSDENFKFVSCERVQEKGTTAIGFLSAQMKFCIKYKTEDRFEQLHIFVKTMPESKQHREMVISTGGFTKEVILFEQFFIDFKKKIEGNPIPTCYIARDNDIIVLNDLSNLGFSNVPLLETFSLEHCEKAIESISKLHAASLVFEIKNNCKINEFIPILKKETIFSKDENNPGRKFMRASTLAFKEIRNKYMDHYPEDLTNKVFTYMDNVVDLMGPSLIYPNAFSHCDLWTNNLMFSYDKQNKVRECCLIDFQLASVKPVTYDLQMLLHLCTNKELRDNHYHHLEEYYYKKLSENLSLESIDISRILPRNEYKSLLSVTRPILLALAPQFLHFVLMPDHIIRDIMKNGAEWKYYYEENRTLYILRAAAENPQYRTRVIDALTEAEMYHETDSGKIRILSSTQDILQDSTRQEELQLRVGNTITKIFINQLKYNFYPDTHCQLYNSGRRFRANQLILGALVRRDCL